MDRACARRAIARHSLGLDRWLAVSAPQPSWGRLFEFIEVNRMPLDLSSYSSAHFDRGASRLREALWLLTSLLLFRLCPFSFSAVKCSVLRSFGASIGKNVTIKPQVKITFPWKLTLGDDVWLGEECWLLNLERITIRDNVCISQRAFLCTGSHNYKVPTFDLITKPITVESGAWLSAGCWVGPGVVVGAGSVLSAGSVATRNLQSGGLYRGNPAALVQAEIRSGQV